MRPAMHRLAWFSLVLVATLLRFPSLTHPWCRGGGGNRLKRSVADRGNAAAGHRNLPRWLAIVRRATGGNAAGLGRPLRCPDRDFVSAVEPSTRSPSAADAFAVACAAGQGLGGLRSRVAAHDTDLADVRHRHGARCGCARQERRRDLLVFAGRRRPAARADASTPRPGTMGRLSL